MNSELFTSLRDRKFPGSPKGVLIFCSFPFVYACVFVCVLMRYRKARGPNKFPFLFCWLIIIIISIFSAIFEPFLSFYRSFSFFSSLVHLNGKKPHQQIANGILMATAAAVGLLFYFLGETKQRRAFLEAKQSLDVKMVIEEQSAEQVTEYLFSSSKSA